LKYRPGRVHAWALAALALVGLLLLGLVERSRAPEAQPWFREKMQAATLTRQALESIREVRLGMGGPIDVVNDPNDTGLIGPEFSLITTSRGSHDAKLRALDPNMAAVFVQLLERAGVREGDLVAVGLSGSYPLLNAAMLVAIETIGATPVAITSVGSSMWGATDPGLTWLDMEAILLERGIIHHGSIAASIGGGDDRGRGLPPRGRELVRDAATRNGVPLIEEPSLDESIARRMQIYDERADGRAYALYANVGGGLGSVGTSRLDELVPAGLSRVLGTKNFPRRGALVRMADRGVPVVHVPSADPFIDRYGLSVEPVPIPEVGEGGVFYQDHYNVPLAAVLAVLYGFLIFVVVRVDLKHYLFRRPKAEA
jgi:poly-gamma-glutamate system protein